MIRAFDIGPDITYHTNHNGKTQSRTPGGSLANGLPTLLDRVTKQFDHEGVVILDDAAAARLQIPTGIRLGREGTYGSPDSTAAVLGSATNWATAGIYGWTTLTDKTANKVVHVTTRAWIKQTRCPLVMSHPADTVRLLSQWHDATGCSWHGEPGAAGLAVLRSLKPKNHRLAWWCPETVGPAEESTQWAAGAHELPWSPADWRGPSIKGPDGNFAHQYDRRRASIAAANTVIVAAEPLEYSERREFDPKRGGWWLCEIPVWNIPQIPHPAGPGTHNLRWLTTPTVTLLNNLAEQGYLGNFYLHGSWTAPGVRLYRRWAEVLEKVAKAGITGEADSALTDAAKAAMSEGQARMNSPVASTWIFRPDHYYSMVANKRTAVWRVMWDVWNVEKRHPIAVDDDAVWYPSASRNGSLTAPQGIKLGTSLGQWQYKLTRARTGERRVSA